MTFYQRLFTKWPLLKSNFQFFSTSQVAHPPQFNETLLPVTEVTPPPHKHLNLHLAYYIMAILYAEHTLDGSITFCIIWQKFDCAWPKKKTHALSTHCIMQDTYSQKIIKCDTEPVCTKLHDHTLMERSEFRRFHRPTSSDASILRTR